MNQCATPCGHAGGPGYRRTRRRRSPTALTPSTLCVLQLITEVLQSGHEAGDSHDNGGDFRQLPRDLVTVHFSASNLLQRLLQAYTPLSRTTTPSVDRADQARARRTETAMVVPATPTTTEMIGTMQLAPEADRRPRLFPESLRFFRQLPPFVLALGSRPTWGIRPARRSGIQITADVRRGRCRFGRDRYQVGSDDPNPSEVFRG